MNVGGDLLSVAAAQFGLRLLSQVVRASPGQNVIVSPLGLFQALSLYAFLMDQADRSAIREVLQIDHLSDSDLHGMYTALGRRLQIKGEDTELSYATSFWTGKAVSLEPSFTALAAQWGVTVASGADVTAAEMQTWAREQTRGLLSPSLPPPISTGANLMNAVYFRGTWKSKFENKDTRDRPFYRVRGLPKVTPLMRQTTSRVCLSHDAVFDTARIPYASDSDHELTLHVLLPKRSALDTVTGRDYLTPLVSRFTLNDWDRCQLGYESDKEDVLVDLILPRFTFRQTHNLRPVLAQMGFGKAFKQATAQAPTVLPAIDKVQQQVYVSVNEEGTKAAALTEMSIILGASLYPAEASRPRVEKFYVDRPFLFFLTEERSGLILFAGVIHDPADGEAGHRLK